MLMKLITEVRLNPITLGTYSAHVEGEVAGSLSGLPCPEPAYADTIGSGGWICTRFGALARHRHQVDLFTCWPRDVPRWSILEPDAKPWWSEA